MTLCPVAIAVGCRKCPVFRICLVKGLVGDAVSPPPEVAVKTVPAPKKTPAAGKSRAPAKARGAVAQRRPKTSGKGGEQGAVP